MSHRWVTIVNPDRPGGPIRIAVLGMLLALVYEATGSIRVAIIAHGLFNLNTIILLLSGLTQSNS